MSIRKLVYALSVAAVVAGALVSLAVMGRPAPASSTEVLPEVVVTAEAPKLEMDTVEVVSAVVNVHSSGLATHD